MYVWAGVEMPKVSLDSCTALLAGTASSSERDYIFYALHTLWRLITAATLR